MTCRNSLLLLTLTIGSADLSPAAAHAGARIKASLEIDLRKRNPLPENN